MNTAKASPTLLLADVTASSGAAAAHVPTAASVCFNRHLLTSADLFQALLKMRVGKKDSDHFSHSVLLGG